MASTDNLSHEQFIQPGKEFARLTYQGQLYYADRRSDGADHATAYADAKYSYGEKRA